MTSPAWCREQMTGFGLIGRPVIIPQLAVLFDVIRRRAPGARDLPSAEFIWELSPGINFAVWGFKRDSPILSPAAR